MKPAFSSLSMAVLMLTISSAAHAGEIVDNATAAESLLAEKNPVQALALLEQAFNLIWDQTPLGFSEAVFVTDRPAGFGVFETRPNALFKSGEPMMVYAEPYGFGYGEKDGQFTIDLKADYALKTDKGVLLHDQQGFADLKMTSHRRNKEFQVFITYNIEGLRPGDYVLTTSLRDENSAKSGSFDLPFTIAADPKT